MSAPFTPGLPPAGAAGAFIGRDAQDNLYLLHWNEANGWEALGWVGAGKAAMPALRHPAGQDQGLIVGHTLALTTPPAQAPAPSPASGFVPIKLATGQNGWTIDPETLEAIATKVNGDGWDCGQWEGIEGVLLAVGAHVLSNLAPGNGEVSQ